MLHISVLVQHISMGVYYISYNVAQMLNVIIENILFEGRGISVFVKYKGIVKNMRM